MLRCTRLSAACVLALALSATYNGTAEAAKTGRASPALYGGLEAAPGERALRSLVGVRYDSPPTERAEAWEAFLQGAGSRRWRASWDTATKVPSRIWGAGIAAPGSSASAPLAEASARRVLAANIALLAPGSSPDDFVLVANDAHRGLRMVAFRQIVRSAEGGSYPVIGGQVSFRYKADRLVVIGSEAAPHAALRPVRVTPAEAERAALTWTRSEHGEARMSQPATLAVLPMSVETATQTRTVYKVEIEASSPRARWAVYVDARTGRPVAREQLLRFAEAEAVFNVPIHGPNGPRQDYPARFASARVEGIASFVDQAGKLSWGGADSTLTLAPTGERVIMDNGAGGLATSDFPLASGAVVAWGAPDDEQVEAQLASFVHVGIVEDRVRQIDAASSALSAGVKIRPNVADPYGCNAFWDGSALNFYLGNSNCNNTARVAGVVYHEYGHRLHQYTSVAGAGSLDPSLGEGVADYLSAITTGDPGVARGFYTSSPVTSLRYVDDGRRWPDDISAYDPHETGLIIAGALWNLRGGLIASIGESEGIALSDAMFESVLRGAANIPAAYSEVLAFDDDDGDLDNGTPHVCEINQAFLQHGLAPMLDASGLRLEHQPLSVVGSDGAPYPVVVTKVTSFPQCEAPEIRDVTFRWGLRGGGHVLTSLDLVGGEYVGEIDAKPQGTELDYQFAFAAGSTTYRLPNNIVDNKYKVYVGPVVPLYTTGFEDGADDWVLASRKGGGDFEWGEPLGLGGDPAVAHSGSKVIGTKLGKTGLYRQSRTSYAESPAIDRRGSTRLRLQFWRWLQVESGRADAATITVNGAVVWQNSRDDRHIDEEWRFEDIPIDPLVLGEEPTVKVSFELISDKEGNLGGWNIDDFALVSEPDPPKNDAPVDPPPVDLPEPAPSAATFELAGGCATSQRGSAPTGWGLFALGALVTLARRRDRTRR